MSKLEQAPERAKEKFDLVKQEVERILPNSPLDFELKHSQLVLKWLLELKPDSDEALKISAVSHDMERALTGITEKDLKDFSKINEFKKEHSVRSAEYICDILKKHGYSAETIDRVRYLVENHEFGGENDADYLTDADSLAYFDYNIPSYWSRNGRERAKEKVKFMYRRLTPKAKELITKMKFENEDVAQLVKEAILEI